MGVTVRQKVKGKGKPWWVFVAHQGQRKSIMVGDKATAETVAQSIREELNLGKLNLAKPQVPTFGDYAGKWFKLHGQDLKYSTLKNYQGIFKNHLGPLADRPLDQITRPELKDLIRGKDHLSRATQTRIKALISVILSHAVEDELITANPASGLGRHLNRKQDKKANVDALTCEEAAKLLAVMQEHYPRYQPFFLTAIMTGLRLGELLALEWGDIDFNGHFIEVRRSYVEGRITTPKNHQSRKVDMSDGLADALRELHTQRKKDALAKWGGKVPDLVFVNEAGHVLDHANLRRRVFWPALEKASLRRIRIHDLRHTYASLLIGNGETLAYVRDQLGHHSIQITVDTYGHLVPGANRQAVCKLDRQLGCIGGAKNGTKGQILQS